MNNVAEVLQKTNEKRKARGLQPIAYFSHEQMENLLLIGRCHPSIRENPVERLSEILSWEMPWILIDSLKTDSYLFACYP